MVLYNGDWFTEINALVEAANEKRNEAYQKEQEAMRVLEKKVFGISE